METTLCARCHKNPRNVRSGGQVYSYCRDCVREIHREWSKKPENAEKIREARRRIRADNPEKERLRCLTWWREHPEKTILLRKRIKRQVLTWYGGVCVCCGESLFDLLTLDHVYDDGYKERSPKNNRRTSVGSSNYRNLFNRGKENLRRDLQILCGSCQLGKKINYGFCPHHPTVDLRIPQQEILDVAI